ncbi:hypothetical protein ANN_12091 [Periplaneta americana]|uniref:Uncharacterized protein n=1 Tax=Periplaneta americana TaxID=6978 RepID=A0ABQ8T6V7_PERAM|nr:hypothetical protein ANN_12091 [Periplaneta americana]
MAGLCEDGNEPPGSLKANEGDNAGEMSPWSSTESYPAFARIGLRENSGKNLNQVTCSDRKSNPGHLVSRPDVLTVTPQAPHTRGGLRLDQVITQRGEEEMAGVCRQDGETLSSVVR